MLVDALEARVLLGWMKRDEAVAFLREQCVFHPAISDSQAEELWKPVRAAVCDMKRQIVVPERLALNADEKVGAEKAMSFYQGLGLLNVKDIVKIDPFGLVVHQNYILTERAMSYARILRTPEEWFIQAIQPELPKPREIQMFTMPNALNVDVPHGEFFVHFDVAEAKFAIQENMRYVAVHEIPQMRRMILLGGYHRLYARILRTGQEQLARPLMMILAKEGPADASSEEPGFRETLCGPNSPLFCDFFDERFFVTVKLRKRRYQVQVRAACVPIDG